MRVKIPRRFAGGVVFTILMVCAPLSCSEDGDDDAADEQAGGEDQSGFVDESGPMDEYTGPFDEDTYRMIALYPDAPYPNPYDLEFFEQECGAYAGTSAPLLYAPIYRVNGDPADDLADTRVGDQVTVIVPFEDADCDLSCGAYYVGARLTTAAGSQASNIPCGTASSNVVFGFFFILTDTSTIPFSLMLDDRTGLSTSLLSVVFTPAP